MSPFADTIMRQKYLHTGETNWRDIATRVVGTVMGPYFPHLVDEMTEYVADRKFMPGGRYLYATGKDFHQTQNCLLMTVEDSRESISNLLQRVQSGLMTGAGIGIVWSRLRSSGTRVGGMGGDSTGPTAFMQSVNEVGRHTMQGGSRRAAIWAGLHWWHPDVFKFMTLKDWPEYLVQAKEDDYNAAAPMDMTNISVILDTAFFEAIDDPTWTREYENGESGETFTVDHDWALSVYWSAVEKMLSTGEPGFSIDAWENEGENLRNACTEVTSKDDNDICNLGSINMARVDHISEFERLVELGTAFLLCGTLYSKVPYQEVADTREKNRRLGLGLMGIYEWLVKRGYRYEPNAELQTWLEAYTRSTLHAWNYAGALNISAPVKTRAIAPTGTIGILAETTTGIEPLFATAYKRRYLKGSTWHYQYVIEPMAQKFIDMGIDPANLETAYDLANDPARRLEMQAFVQRYVDHGISSTLNLPAHQAQTFTSEEFGKVLLDVLPHLRGLTVYPDGARGGQPLNVVPYQEAADWEGYEYEEVGNGQACVSGVCGV
jgi:ribonucleoside-diphosphate reductase alpha chain